MIQDKNGLINGLIIYLQKDVLCILQGYLKKHIKTPGSSSSEESIQEDISIVNFQSSPLY